MGRSKFFNFLLKTTTIKAFEAFFGVSLVFSLGPITSSPTAAVLWKTMP
jgi:hypothetical protein